MIVRVAAVSDEIAVSVRGLHKNYGEFEAVRGIDLEVRSGEIFAFLGPNGAGKTTTVEILEGYRKATSGEVSVLGRDPQKGDSGWRARLGIVLQSCDLQPELTVRETLQQYAGYYPHPRPVDETIEQVGLAEKADVRAGKLSGGQKRRTDVALALIGDPDLIFLDEPTTGFDPSARHQAWKVIENLKSLGKTVFLTTHYMDEAQTLADRVAVIQGGKIVATGTPDDIGGRSSGATTIRFALPAGRTTADLPSIGSGYQQQGGYVHVDSPNPTADLHTLTGWAIENSIELLELEAELPSLEQVYLELTSKAASA